jgi:hypothetical protein
MWQSPLSWQRYVWFWPTSTLNPFKFTTLYLLSQVLDITIKWTIDIVHMHVLLILANHNSVTKCRILKKKQSKFLLLWCPRLNNFLWIFFPYVHPNCNFVLLKWFEMCVKGVVRPNQSIIHIQEFLWLFVSYISRVMINVGQFFFLQ